jgi:hypothetical protein
MLLNFLIVSKNKRRQIWVRKECYDSETAGRDRHKKKNREANGPLCSQETIGLARAPTARSAKTMAATIGVFMMDECTATD